MTYCGVILDTDGTLVDSNDAHAHAWVEAFSEHGYEVPFERVRPLIGMGSDMLMPEVVGLGKETPEGSAISERRGEVFKSRYLPHIEPFPEVRALLERMKGAGLELVVASSAEEDELAALLEIAGVTDLVSEQVSSSDAEASKPAPDTVRVALERLHCPPDKVLMIGDTPFDLEAAKKAGVGVIALRCGGWGDEDLTGAVAVYDDPADLLRHFGTSPLGTQTSRK